MKPIIKVLLIVYIAMGGVLFIAGIVMFGISLAYGINPPIGPFLSLAGLVMFLGGIWLFKRGGKGILTRGTGTADSGQETSQKLQERELSESEKLAKIRERMEQE